MAIDRPGAYAHLRRLPLHGWSPFRSCPRLVLAFQDRSFGILTSESFQSRTGDFHPTTITPMTGVPIACTGAAVASGFSKTFDLSAATHIRRSRIEISHYDATWYGKTEANQRVNRRSGLGKSGHHNVDLPIAVTRTFGNKAAVYVQRVDGFCVRLPGGECC